MDFGYSLEVNKEVTVSRGESSQLTVERDRNSEGLSYLTPGQIISGTVVSVDQQVTLDFNGHKVATSKDVLKYAVPGEVKSFEVVKASSSEIELKLLEGNVKALHRTIKALSVKEKDWETIRAKREQSGRHFDKEKATQEALTKLEEISIKFTEQDYKALEKEGFPAETMPVSGLYEAINRVKEAISKEADQIGTPQVSGALIAREVEPTVEDIDKAYHSTSDEQTEKRMELTAKEATAKTNKVNTSQAREASSVKITGEEIAIRLKEANLPANEQNIDRIRKAIALSDTVTKIDNKAMKYLIAREVDPTIENIYKAYYSASTKQPDKNRELSAKEWKELEGQVKDVIQEAGYEVNDGSLSEAKWLLENELPLTATTFSYKKELGEIKANTDTDIVLDRILEGMKAGTAPKDVSLATQSIPALENTIDKLNSIGEEAVAYAIQEKLDINIKNLAAVQEDLSAGKIQVDKAKQQAEVTEQSNEVRQQAEGTTHRNEAVATELRDGWKEERIIATGQSDYDREEVVNTDNEDYIANERTVKEAPPEDSENSTGEETTQDRNKYEQVKVHRQLEELRLKMTLEAAGRLEKKGIHIETERLEKVVEELRELEDSYYRKLLSEMEVESTSEAMETLQATTRTVAQLKQMPCAVIGATLTDRETQTLPDLITSGTKLSADYEKAGIAYETLATVPNAEYGDSIRKAFANMESLLTELNIENTQINQRAVRILGYNSMEITPEAIEKVKAYDKEVTSVIENLHPAVTVRIIKEGINPLSMPIDELNTVIDQMKEEQGISTEDRFSTYLHKLEKENGITPQERNAYIGIYRLLYNVDKTDGAAIGAVLKANQEVTLSHLLTAVQTERRGRVSATVDDEFGMLTELNRNKESIAEQLKGFSNPIEATSDDSANRVIQQEVQQEVQEEIQQEAQEKYLRRVVKQITEEISPTKLKNLQQQAIATTTASQTLHSTEPAASGEDANPWESIRNTSLEKLLEQLQETVEEDSALDEIYVQKGQQIRELCKNSEQSLRFLNDYQMTSSPQNIMIASHILSNGISPIVRLMKRQNENSIEISENKLKELNELSDTLIDKSSMNEAYTSLEEQAKEALIQACSQETLDSSKLAELKNIGQQMSFLRKMASREFYQIPIETDHGITNMNLTILRGSGTSGRVAVTVWSKELGDIKAEFSLKEKSLKGFIACDNRDGLKRLQGKAAEIETAALDSNITLKQLDFGISSKDLETYSYQNPQDLGQSTGESLNTERTLYRLAKAIVQTVRLAESSARIAL